MAKKYREILPIILMLISLALLLISQAVWLQRSYRAEKVQFQKRAGELLDISVRALYDSLTLHRLRQEMGLADTCQVQFKMTNEQANQTISYAASIHTDQEDWYPPALTNLMGRDSLHPSGADTSLRQTIVISHLDGYRTRTRTRTIDNATFVPRFNTGLDSLFSIADRSPLGVQVLLGMTNDTLSIDTLREAYLDHLVREDMDLHFSLLPADSLWPANIPALSTDAVSVSIFGNQGFIAHFPKYAPYLLGRMWEEILFSFFLFGMIALAFAFIYRSLLKQRRLSLLKNDLLSNITHELKTPISSVSVAIEALRDFGVMKNPDLTREYLDISRDELQRLSLLVDRVLRLTTFEQKEPDLHFEQLDLAEVSQTILQTMQVQFDQYEAESELSFQGQHFIMEGDRTHLSSVLFNLLDNALKYRNGKQPKVILTVAEKDDAIEIKVRDNGLGIPSVYQDKIFEKFFRVPQGNIHNTKGYGLGLSYVAAVVAKHEGSITLESTENVGSTFSLSFPKNQSKT